MRRCIPLLLLPFAAIATHAAAQLPPPRPLVVAATIVEAMPLSQDIAKRRVLLRLRLSSSPSCTAGASDEFGFLIDADKQTETGVRHPAAETLGFDARVTLRCDAATRRYVSPLGSVTQKADTLELATTAERLPSLDFLWAPYAAVGNEVALSAARPNYSHWAVFERSMP